MLKEFLEKVKKIADAHPKKRRYDEEGQFYPDPTPIAPPIGYERKPSLAEQIRAMVRSEELRRTAEREGFETFEEADDYDVGDDYDPRSPFELQFDPPEPLIPDQPKPAEKEGGAAGGSPKTPPDAPPVPPAPPQESQQA